MSNGWLDAATGTTNRINRAESIERETRRKRWRATCWYAVFVALVVVAVLGIATAK